VIFPNPVTFAGALWRLVVSAITHRPLLVDSDTLRYRTEVCNYDCAAYDHASGQCRLCTCLVGIKARLATEQCPNKLWRRDLINTRHPG
jgi:hypothetical protein